MTFYRIVYILYQQINNLNILTSISNNMVSLHLEIKNNGIYFCLSFNVAIL